MNPLLAMAVAFLVQAPSETLDIHSKASLFKEDLKRRFLFEGQLACKLRHPTAEVPRITYNMPDNAYLTGIHLATLAMEYAVTGQEQVKAEALQAIQALDLLCNVSGVPGVLARAAIPIEAPFQDDGIWHHSPDGKYRWRGDVSNDQVTGVMYGFLFGHVLIDDPAGRERIARNATAIVDRILDNNLQIMDFDGSLTQWGRYDKTYVTHAEKMNALLLLQHLMVVQHITGKERYREAYQRLAVEEGYADLAVEARKLGDPRIPHEVNHSDDVLLYMAYVPLLMYETDEDLRDKYLRSLRRTWLGDGKYPGVRDIGEPLYSFLASKWLEDDSQLQKGLECLQLFPLDMKWNQATLKAYATEFGFVHEAIVRSPVPAAGEPVPIDRRPKAWSAWVQDSYQAGERHQDGDMEFNGHDYLWAYWVGRYEGWITHQLPEER